MYPILTNMRAQGTVWENHFTKVITDTSAGGKNITEATPNTGDGFATFPLCECARDRHSLLSLCSGVSL